MSDNGSRLINLRRVITFLKADGIQELKSDPYHPKTNERFVRTLKDALKNEQSS